MSKKKDKKLEKQKKKLDMLDVECSSLNERIRQAREELGYIEYNKMRIKRDIKQMMDRQDELSQKRFDIIGSCETACSAPRY